MTWFISSTISAAKSDTPHSPVGILRVGQDLPVCVELRPGGQHGAAASAAVTTDFRPWCSISARDTLGRPARTQPWPRARTGDEMTSVTTVHDEGKPPVVGVPCETKPGEHQGVVWRPPGRRPALGAGD